MTFFWIGYGVIALIALRPLAGHITYRLEQEPEGVDWAVGIFIALTLMWTWPLVLVFVVSGRLLPSMGAEREAEIKAQQRRIKQLERELDLR